MGEDHPRTCIYLHVEIMRRMLLENGKLRRDKARLLGLDPCLRNKARLVEMMLKTGIVHHRDGNTENCRDENLELVTVQQNVQMSALNCNNMTGYTGVVQTGATWKALVYVSVNGKLIARAVASGLPNAKLAAVARVLGMLTEHGLLQHGYTPRQHESQAWRSVLHLLDPKKKRSPCPWLELELRELPKMIRNLLFFAAKRQRDAQRTVKISFLPGT